jgi:hypothetical protein
MVMGILKIFSDLTNGHGDAGELLSFNLTKDYGDSEGLL